MLCRKNLVYSIWHVWAYISDKAIAFPQPSAILFVFIIVFPDRCITLASQIWPKCCMYNSPSQFYLKKLWKTASAVDISLIALVKLGKRALSDSAFWRKAYQESQLFWIPEIVLPVVPGTVLSIVCQTFLPRVNHEFNYIDAIICNKPIFNLWSLLSC